MFVTIKIPGESLFNVILKKHPPTAISIKLLLGISLFIGLCHTDNPRLWAYPKDLKIWWSEAGTQIFPDTPRPRPARPVITLNAAQNETEAFQLILQSSVSAPNIMIQIDPFQHQTLQTRHHFRSTAEQVEFVRITNPSDATGRVGEWPDPLPPCPHPFNLPGHRNFPIYITVYIPTDCPAGDYRSQVRIQLADTVQFLPIRLHVWNFSLPAKTTLRSGFGISPKLIARYHQLELDSPEFTEVWKRYLQNFAAHRLSPYNVMDLDPIRINLRPQTSAPNSNAASQPAPGLQIDFTQFDRQAHYCFDELGFNAFQLTLEGLGQGSFYSRTPGKFANFTEGSTEYQSLFPQYVKGVVTHLRAKGWLDQAYLYWFDEPQAKDYEYICQFNRQLRELAPGLKLFLTEEPRPELKDCVDIWCLEPREFDRPAIQAAQARGQEVWWYLCTNPKSPYPTLFIDSPLINLRIWIWMTWQYRLSGIFVWQTLYWTSETAFQPPARQDPWADPMSYVSGYGVPAGARGPWGNGDGRFLYPPRLRANQSGPQISDPINSLRWEMLRAGLEDYEYFHILATLAANRSNWNDAPKLRDEIQAALQIPKSIIRDLTHYTRDVRRLDRHRQRMAQLIEKINALPN
ncbi:DUF4091 domain-containing protein [candidate division KSB1 bacterium]|nr:DUF4091 domain-containing protein [candidate division KSB1 bacterium]